MQMRQCTSIDCRRVSDVRTGFLTTHEKKEFDKIHDHLVNVSRETDALYQMCIVLSKYDYDDEHSPKKPGVSVQYGDEIVDEDEVCSVPSMV